AVQPGIQWIGLGSKAKLGTESSEQDLHYLGVPIALQFMPGSNGFFLELGGQANFLLTAREEDQVTNVRMGNKDAFDKLDVGAFGGVGYLTRIGLGITAKYYYGLTNILEDGGGNNSSNDGPELKNRAYQFGLVYHFGAAK
ncbi:MAG: PorT family protein, partial [Chitinophagaceae bacterium]